MNKYVLVVGDGKSYYEPFEKFGKFTRDLEVMSQPEKVSLVVFTGGSDISPSLYGHKPNRLTYCNPKRDVYELMAFRRAHKNNLPMAGICRGSQFLCAMAGGTLYQHISGHDWQSHSIRTWDDREVKVTSSHHQMQNPPESAIILGWAEPTLSKVYLGENDEEIEPPEFEYECVYYPNIKAVGMQYHPECMHDRSAGFLLASELVDTWLFAKV